MLPLTSMFATGPETVVFAVSVIDESALSVAVTLCAPAVPKVTGKV